jgi:uncharacterized protein (TIGR04222 family)
MIEGEVCDTLPIQRDDKDALKTLRKKVKKASAELIERNLENGYLMPKWWSFLTGCAAFLPIALVLIFLAYPRLTMGIHTGKPFLFLLFVMIISGLFGLVFSFVSNDSVTPRGRALMRILQKHYADFYSPQLENISVEVAVLGIIALSTCADEDLAALMNWFPRTSFEGNSCGSGCSGGGCGGGCGGCGGCGG